MAASLLSLTSKKKLSTFNASLSFKSCSKSSFATPRRLYFESTATFTIETFRKEVEPLLECKYEDELIKKKLDININYLIT